MSRAVFAVFVALACALLCSPVRAQNMTIIPGAAEQNNSTNTPTQSGERSLQAVYDVSISNALPLGARITGMAFRMNGGQAAAPASDRTWTSYDVRLATSILRPGLLSSTYATNESSDAVAVRTGALTIPALSLPGGATPNGFGSEIAFTTPFTYMGGHLLLGIRHTGNGVDAPIIDGTADYPGYAQCRINTNTGAYTATTSTGTGVAPTVLWTWQPATGPQEIVMFNGTTTAHPRLTDGQTGRILFGTVPAGLTGETRTFTIGNAGSLPLSGLVVNVDGADAADFLMTQPASTSVAAGARTTFTITFRPSAASTRNATLRVLSNDADEASFDVPLRGVGSLGRDTFFREANVVMGRADFSNTTAWPSAIVMPGPAGCALSSDGKFAVADQTARRVLIWNSIPTTNGQPANVVVGKANFTNVTTGTTQTTTSFCNGVAFSPDGQKLIVADSGNARVLIWNTVPTTNGAPADVVIGQTDFVTATGGLSASKFASVTGLLVTPDGRLLVSDSANDRVLIFNSIPTTNGASADVVIGQPDMVSTSPGNTANKMDAPWHLALSPDGRLLVADAVNNRVLVFNTVPTVNGTSADVVIGQADFGASIVGTSAAQMDQPFGVAVSASGQLAIAEDDNDRVMIFNSVPTSNGAAADYVLGQPDFISNADHTGGISAASMNEPWAVAYAPDGRLLVAGRDMGRVMVFSPAVATLSAPVAGTLTKSPVSIAFTLQEHTLPGTAQVVFDNGTTPRAVTLAGSQESAGAHSFAFDPANPTASPAIAAGLPIPDGVHTITLAYQAHSGGSVLSAPVGNVRIDTTAPSFSLPGPITVEATSSAGRMVSYSAGASDSGSGVASSSFVPASGSEFPLGTTTVNASATDVAGNTGAASFTVTVQDTTAPVVTPPANLTVEATSAAGATVNYADATAIDAVGVASLMVSQASGTTFPIGTTTVTVTAKDAANNAGTATFSVTVVDTTAPVVTPPGNVTVEATSAAGAVVNYADATASDAVGVTTVMYSHASGTTFPLGTTMVTVTAKDAANNTGTATFSVTVQDTTAPVVTPPANLTAEATSATGATVNYADATASDAVGVTSLIVSQVSGTVFPLGTTTVMVTAKDAANNTGTATFSVTVQDTTAPVVTPPANVTMEATSAAGATVNYADATAIDAVGVASLMVSQASGTVFPLGTTTVTVTAKDAANNTGTATFSVTVQDTIAPTIDGVFSPLIFVEGTPLPDYRAQAQTSDATTVAVAQDPPPGSVTSAGTLTVKLTASDLGTNSTELRFDVAVRATRATHDIARKSGDPAPGAGAAGGPPADALLASFGVPAIDGAGNVAFTAKWTSAATGKGAGLFLNDRCLAIAGGDASAVAGAGATWKSFAEPVIDGGKVVCLATLGGVPKTSASAIVGNRTGPAFEKIARAGEAATGDGARFKAFKAVAVAGSGVAFLAELAAGTGTPRTTAASDMGLWVQDGASAPVLVLRDGDGTGSLPIVKLVAFKAGAGSPGQGRGWLRMAGAVPEVLALATASDRSQFLLSANATTRTVLATTSAALTSFGVPAANAAGKTAFLALQPAARGALRSVRSQGIFITEGDDAGATGAAFAAFRDPVLAADDAFAFPATIAGGTVKGLAKTTVWWHPPGDMLRLLAQGGAEPAELPGAQWKSFPSLAIAANRGPIFVGMLVPGKGAVTKATASGVWACDFTGALRLLFRTGDTDIVAGKMLKSFTLLNVVRGSEGVTRSFNDNAQIVWRATFDDKSQAIVTTEVP